jgi:hypothetical protein
MRQATERLPKQSRERVLFWSVFGLGALLRLIPLFYPMPMDDGVLRLSKSIEWARQPEWYGLGGQWPPLMMYLQGMLIRTGVDALWVAYSIGYLTSVASLLLVYRLSLAITGNPSVALWSMLACSVYWYHIAILNMNLIENFYTLILLAFILQILRTISKETAHSLDFVILSALVALLLLNRHEARLVWIVSALYLLWIREYRVFWVVTVSGALVTAYLLTENLLLRGSLLADLESATRNFLTAIEIRGEEPTVTERLMSLRRPLLFQPSVILLGAAAWGAYKSFHTACTRFIILICGASVLLILFGTFTSPLIPFWRYFVPIIVPAMALTGVGLTAMPIRGAATFLLTTAILVQAGHWHRSQSFSVGNSQLANMIPVHRLHPSQESLQKFVETLPRNARIYAMVDPYTPVDIRQAAINTRRYNLIPSLYLYKNYNQYIGKLVTVPPTHDTFRKMDFVIIDRDHPESWSAIQTVYRLGCKVVYERDSLIVFQMVLRDDTDKTL